jgi:hypothetical protein
MGEGQSKERQGNLLPRKVEDVDGEVESATQIYRPFRS